MAKSTTKTEEVKVSIPAIAVETAVIHVVGDSPLIVHKWSEKAKKMILDKQMKKAKTTAHDAKDPVSDFIESLYWLEGEPEKHTEAAFMEAVEGGAKFGFPAVAFKASAVAAAYRAGITKNLVTMNGAFHVLGEMVEIQGVPEPREDMVRIAMGGTDIRYRGEFPTWEATFTVRYNKGVLSIEQLVNMFNLGGFACGVGEWRPEKGGTFGMYHVE